MSKFFFFSVGNYYFSLAFTRIQASKEKRKEKTKEKSTLHVNNLFQVRKKGDVYFKSVFGIIHFLKLQNVSTKKKKEEMLDTFLQLTVLS